MAIFKHFAKAIYSKEKLSEMADFDRQDKKHGRIFPFMAKFVFYGLL